MTGWPRGHARRQPQQEDHAEQPPQAEDHVGLHVEHRGHAGDVEREQAGGGDDGGDAHGERRTARLATLGMLVVVVTISVTGLHLGPGSAERFGRDLADLVQPW